MAISNAVKNFQMNVDPAFVAKAEALTPRLHERTVLPVRAVEILPDGEDFAAAVPSAVPFEPTRPMGRDSRLTLDFGGHLVGYLSFTLTPVGSPADAPAYLRLRFGEIPYELAADPAEYRGEISRSWIQQEELHIDELPSRVELPRRYAFRYLEITVLDASAKYRVELSGISCRAVTSADMDAVPPLAVSDPELAALDRVSLATMRDCMQSVFEDGPKRDRRLWLADLRLQALTNYVTFRNFDLVKRCLYLFAGLTMNGGQAGACLFHNSLQVDDTALFDYSLFFVSALSDYYEASGDRETLEELFPTACRQIELALRELDGRGIVRDRDGWWCFLDWGEGLNKQAGAQAVLIYAVKQARTMASWLGRDDLAREYEAQSARLTAAALAHLWDGAQGFFVSGAQRQVSWASQVWFVLAGVFEKEDNARLLKRLAAADPAPRMDTPYMVHHYIEALLESGLRERALEYMKFYWGGMLARGADTFWEVYDPGDPAASPYGSRLINSYCHAWSGTPAYFIRKYFARD